MSLLSKVNIMSGVKIPNELALNAMTQYILGNIGCEIILLDDTDDGNSTGILIDKHITTWFRGRELKLYVESTFTLIENKSLCYISYLQRLN